MTRSPAPDILLEPIAAIVTQSVVIIRGKVTPLLVGIALQIIINAEAIAFDSYIISSQVNFIALGRLKLGQNKLVFQYGQISKELSITKEHPRTEYTIVPIYIIVQGHDGCFQSDTSDNSSADACKRIDLALDVVQSIFAYKTPKHNTFCLANTCVEFHSELSLSDAAKCNPEQLWQFLAREIISKQTYNYYKTKYIAFLGCTRYNGLNGLRYSHENIVKNTTANPCISTGGLALLGTGCLYSWADSLDNLQSALMNKKKVDVETLLDDSNYRRTYGGCYSTSLGSLCHEIGHLFDLGHTLDGFMGNGIDYIHRIFLCKNFTEVLLSRIVCGQRAISTNPPNKYTQFRNQGAFLLRYQEQKNNDLSFFTNSCCIILEHHKWLRPNTDETRSNVIRYDQEERKVFSDGFPLRLVELRDNATSLVAKVWTFVDNDVYEFTVPNEHNLSMFSLFAINHNGEILKI